VTAPATQSPVPLRDAATVLIVRDGLDGLDGLEVFMLKRNLNSDFVGGAYVFPGGAVDDHDRHLDLEPVCDGRSDADASRRLGVGGGGLAFWIAAIRESFEEAGVLLARDGDGYVDLDAAHGLERWARLRDQVDTGQLKIVDLCQAEGLRLAVGDMHYFGHWITPEGAPRRYDTRFFLTAAPPNQTPTILPRVIAVDGGMRIVLPGDPAYGDPSAAPDASLERDWMRVADGRTVTGFGASGGA
jgi:8-oxo-dGTP pyrophosphatase MutT (NUDIX family)